MMGKKKTNQMQKIMEVSTNILALGPDISTRITVSEKSDKRQTALYFVYTLP